MTEYLIIGIISLALFLIGSACIARPQQMQWVTRGLVTFFLPEKAQLGATRFAGVVIIIVSLVLLMSILKSLF